MIYHITRDKTNFDIFWLKDESLEDTENLPPPEMLAQMSSFVAASFPVQPGRPARMGDPVFPVALSGKTTEPALD